MSYKSYKCRFCFLATILGAGSFIWHVLSAAAWAAPLKVVATQTLFADLVKQIGQDQVAVKSVVSPKFNIHLATPTPLDVRRVREADLYVTAGLDAEPWSDALLEASGNHRLFRGQPGHVDLSQGIALLKIPQRLSRADGDIHVFGNPHYHMNPENAKIMADTILRKLQAAAPEQAAFFAAQAETFLNKLEQKLAEWKALCQHCQGQEIISYHDDLCYFTQFLGMKSEQFIEPKPGIPPAPKHLNFLESYTKEHGVKAVVLPTYFSRQAARQLAVRTGAKIVTLIQGAGEIPETVGFFEFFDYNIRQISQGVR